MEINKLELVQTVNETLNELIGGDVIKGIIKTQLEKTVKDIIESSMREYSDFGKAIKEKINGVIGLAASNVELPEYTKFVSTVVLQQFDTVLQSQAKDHLTKLIATELGEIPTGVMTASQLYQRIADCFESDEYEDERVIEVQLEENERGTIYIKVIDDEKSEEVKITLYNHHRGHKGNYYIGYIESGGWVSRNTGVSERSLNTHCMDKIDRFLFRLYCAQTLIDMSDRSYFDDFKVGGHDY